MDARWRVIAASRRVDYYVETEVSQREAAFVLSDRTTAALAANEQMHDDGMSPAFNNL